MGCSGQPTSTTTWHSGYGLKLSELIADRQHRICSARITSGGGRVGTLVDTQEQNGETSAR
jgi:hypothetical protein